MEHIEFFIERGGDSEAENQRAQSTNKFSASVASERSIHVIISHDVRV